MINLIALVNKQKSFLYLTMIAYFIIYILFLHRADYLPYVMDGNETYSSLVHAYNMYFGDWSKSFGLTDEAFSPFPEAHPVIHTHQGNWPRIYAFLLFALGARSAESQIFLHTISIGAVSIWLMYRYFAKVSSNAYAFIACLIFMTDYILFAQWHVVTYRVWHCYFVFAILNCMHDFELSRKWKVFFVFNFIALFYWELVFAFFVSIWALLYYALMSKSVTKTLIRGCWIAGSGLLGLLTLFTQLSLFMGWEDVVKDFSFTLFARNKTTDPNQLKDILKAFYDNKNIAFFYNMPDSTNLKSLEYYISSFFKYGFQIHTPAIAMLSIVATFGSIINYLRNKINTISWMSECMLDLKVARYLTIGPLLLLCVFISYDYAFAGIKIDFSIIKSVDIIFISVISSYYISYVLFGLIRTDQKVRFVDVMSANMIFIFAAIMIRVLPGYYMQEYSVIWYDELTVNTSVILLKFIVFISCLMLAINCIGEVRSRNKYVFKPLGFLITGAVAYTLVYLLSPGYVYTGYLKRYAPLLVFVVDTCVIILFVNLIIASTFLFKLLRAGFVSFNISKMFVWPGRAFSIVDKLILYILSLLVISALGYQWLQIQVRYEQLFPPTTLNFIKQLRNPEFKNKSIVSNQYTAPFAYETNYWAYATTMAGIGAVTAEGYLIPKGVPDYLWFADKYNQMYDTPDYFLCFMPNSFENVMYKIKSRGIQRYCSANGLMHQILFLDKANDKSKYNIIMHDKDDRWGIVQYNWNFDR